MRAAIDFHDELDGRREHVHDVAPDDDLPAEVDAELASGEGIPQDLLREVERGAMLASTRLKDEQPTLLELQCGSERDHDAAMTPVRKVEAAIQAVLLGCCILCGCGGASRPGASCAAAEDRGIYVSAPQFSDLEEGVYHGAVSSVFSKALGDIGTGCFGMVSIADDRPEEMVIANCRADSAELPVVLVHLVAEESIRAKLRADGPEGARGVKVRRTESTLSAADSRLLRDTWLKMLEHPRVETRMVLHETRRTYYFSALRVGMLQGRLGGVSKNPAANSAAAGLVELGVLLSEIAGLGDSQKTASLLARLRTQARALAATAR